MTQSETTARPCAACGKTGPVADDQTDPGQDELALDARGIVAPDQYVCGACLEAAEDARDSEDGSLVCGCRVQFDPSGVGHAWTDIDAADLHPRIREVIEGEVIDGGRDSGEIVSGGTHYRWS
jgi:hypothetical protein